MKSRGISAPPVRILAGETYLDPEAGRHVVVVEGVLDRAGPAPRQTERFRVVAADGAECGRMWVAHASALAPRRTDEPQPTRPRGGPSRPIASVLACALSRVGAAALPHCQTEEERAIASALAECAVTGGDALRARARVLLAASTNKDDERRSP
jgi:hypothetical protein